VVNSHPLASLQQAVANGSPVAWQVSPEDILLVPLVLGLSLIYFALANDENRLPF